MTDKDYTKIPFFKQLNLKAINPENEKSEVIIVNLSFCSR